MHKLQSVMTDEEGHATVDMVFVEEMIPADYFFQVRQETHACTHNWHVVVGHSAFHSRSIPSR